VDIIYETPLVMAFYHTQPYFVHHIVIIPKLHISSLSEYPNTPNLNRNMLHAISFVTQKLQKSYGGCRVSSDVGSYQSTQRLHWYVYAGKRIRAEDGTVLIEK